MLSWGIEDNFGWRINGFECNFKKLISAGIYDINYYIHIQVFLFQFLW